MKWEYRFLNLARYVASWSKDPSTQCGAVIVRPDRTIASVGFNGLPRGVEDIPKRLLDRDKKLQYVVHAEVNAILTAHEQLTNYAIYVWPFQPCCHCAAAIIQSGIKEVHCPYTTVTRWSESFDTAKVMFAEARITLTLHTNDA
jgi:dCMP deaminase